MKKSILTNNSLNNAVMLNCLKKNAVNIDMLHSPVAIVSVVLATVEHLESLDIELTVTMLKQIIGEIRKNRELSTYILYADNVAFNPEMKIVGTNSRTFPDYFVQKNILKNALYVAPAESEILESVV
jgi:hypothetical protein